ncbi:MAG: type II toxin-antitoxin system death-on-curing family toxin [Nanoarchaeota archaeon]
MKITKKDVLIINQMFDKGIFHNESSLDFALASIRNRQDWMEQASYVLRALLVDHVFQDGNKRTAANLLMLICERQQMQFNPEEIAAFIIQLARDNIQNIKEIKKRIAMLVY